MPEYSLYPFCVVKLRTTVWFESSLQAAILSWVTDAPVFLSSSTMSTDMSTDSLSSFKPHRRSLSDPLTAALRPPPNESAHDRERRLRAEEQAKKTSDEIDELIKAEKNADKKKKAVKVLLLGQSESGKSTTLKRTSNSACSTRRTAHSAARVSTFTHSRRLPRRTDRMALRYLSQPRSLSPSHS